MPGKRIAFGALEHLASQAASDEEEQERKPFLVLSNRCVRLKSRKPFCQTCKDVCPANALFFKGLKIELMEDRCVGCGACATACPTAAIYPEKPSPEELSQALFQVSLANDHEPIIACSQALKDLEEEQRARLNKTRVLPLRCLDILDELVLVDVVAAGAKKVVLCQGDCVACGKGSSGAVCSLVVESTNDLLEAWGKQACVTLQQGLDKEAFNPTSSQLVRQEAEAAARAQEEASRFDRRGFFQEFKTQGGQMAKSTATSLAAERFNEPVRSITGIDLSQEVLNQQMRAKGLSSKDLLQDVTNMGTYRSHNLLLALASMGLPQIQEIDSRFWADLVVDTSTCTGCYLCSSQCITHAIQRKSEVAPDGSGDSRAWLEFYPDRCVQCGMCQALCSHKSITLKSVVNIDNVLTGKVKVIELPSSQFDSYFKNRKLQN